VDSHVYLASFHDLLSIFDNKFELSLAAPCAFQEHTVAICGVVIDRVLRIAIRAPNPFALCSNRNQKNPPPKAAPAIATLSSNVRF